MSEARAWRNKVWYFFTVIDGWVEALLLIFLVSVKANLGLVKKQRVLFLGEVWAGDEEGGLVKMESDDQALHWHELAGIVA